jgi:four helix bundle protein
VVSERPKYSFEDLEVYRKARVFRQDVYRLVHRLPDEEKFALASQMRRAAISLTNNIAEGHGRYHYQENIQFLRQARGSLEELQDDINICLDEEYAKADGLEQLKNQSYELLKAINGYISYLRKRKGAGNDE